MFLLQQKKVTFQITRRLARWSSLKQGNCLQEYRCVYTHGKPKKCTRQILRHKQCIQTALSIMKRERTHLVIYDLLLRWNPPALFCMKTSPVISK